MKLRCVNDFRKMADAELVNKGLGVSAGMTGNAAFPDPPITMAVLNKATQQYSDSLVAAKSRDKIKVATKNKLKKVLIDNLAQLLAYVNAKADGDKPKLLSSGFTLGKESSVGYELGDFEMVKLSPGKNSGDVLVRFNKVKGALSYLIDYTETPVQDDKWKTKPASYISNALAGLTRGKEYNFRIRAIGRDGIEAYSDLYTILVV